MSKLEIVKVKLPAELLEMATRAVEFGEFESIDVLVSSVLEQWRIAREADLSKIRILINEADSSGPPVPWEGVDALLLQFREEMTKR